MTVIHEFSSAPDLMRKVASDPATVTQLASFAQLLGFGWCSGTGSNIVGEDFDVIQQSDRVIVKARYDPKAAKPDDTKPHQRLEMTFRNFRLDVNGGDFRFAPPRITNQETLALSTYRAKNASSVEDTISHSFTYATTESVTHSAGVKLSTQAGVKVSASGGASVPFVADGKVTAEASLVVTAEGSYGYSQSRSSTTSHTAVYTGRLKPLSQRLLKLSVSKAEAEVDYTSEGSVIFDVTLSGFLRAKGNALRSHPTDYPTYECPLMGHGGALGAIRWLADNDRPNASRWDLDWIRQQGWGGRLDAILDFCRQPTRARLRGTFKIAAGFDATIIGGQDTPITESSAADAPLAELADCAPPDPSVLAHILSVNEEPRSSFVSAGD